MVLDVSGDRVRWSYDGITTIYYAEEGWKRKVFQNYVKRKSVLGITTFPSKDIFIKNVFKMFKTSMHEFGHVLLGPDHVHNQFDIMYPYILTSLSDISWRDIKIARKNYSEYLIRIKEI
jgi:predicted Zn-dependent protease